MQNDTVILAKGAGTALFGKIFGRALQLGVQILLARLLGPAQFGLYVLGLTVFQVGQQIGVIGLDNGVIHFGGIALHQNEDKDELSSVIRVTELLSLGSAALLGLVVYVLAPWFALNIIHQADLVGTLRGFSLALVFAIGLKINSAVSRISRKMFFSVFSEDIFPYLVSLVLILLFFYSAKVSVSSAVIAIIVGFGTSFLLILFFLQKLFVLPPYVISMQLAIKLLSFSLPMFFAVVFVYLLYGATNFLIGFFLSSQDVGIYQAASQISTVPVIILVAFNAIFTPMINKFNQESRRPQLNELYKISTKWGLYISLPLFLTVVIMPGRVLGVLYGQVYMDGNWVLVILMIAQLINTGTGAVGYLLVMNNHQKRWLVLVAVAFFIGIVLNIVLIPYWGIIGAACANACAVVVMYLPALLQVRSLLRLWPYDRRYWKGLISAAISAVVVLLISNLFPMEPVSQIVLALGSATGTFLLSLWLLKLEPEDWQVLELVTKKNSMTDKSNF